MDRDPPELVFGLVGPIGCAIHDVADALDRALKEVDYTPHRISLSRLIRDNLPSTAEQRLHQPSCLQDKIDAGNALRRHHDSNGVLAAYAMAEIRAERGRDNERRNPIRDEEDESDTTEGKGAVAPSEQPRPRTAYILDQLKRPEEVDLLGKVYGPRFLQVSVTAALEDRMEALKARTRDDEPQIPDNEVEQKARELVAADQAEEAEPYGQRISEIFHRGDVFIDATDTDTLARTTRRFVYALFGRTNIGPTRDEMGSNLAKTASLRSVDLSRQVGAAATTAGGDLIAIGFNDVPRPLGGQYWDEDEGKARDIDRAHEANKVETVRVIHDILHVLHTNRLFERSPEEIWGDNALRSAITSSRVGDITEYGRMVHAEMSVITDAARLGRSLKGATLYVTTFPCHNCAKHIVASGIARVVYIEPYPKSRALILFDHAITQDPKQTHKVLFQHFSGIAPSRFQSTFEKGKRRGDDGAVKTWYHGHPFPMIPFLDAEYILPEAKAIAENLGPLADNTDKSDVDEEAS